MTSSYNMSEGEYRPQSKGASFKPVDIIDLVPAMEREQSRQSSAERNKLNDITRNNETRLRNSRNYRSTLEALGGFSQTLQKAMVDGQKAENERVNALGQNLAYFAGTSGYEELEKQEDELLESNSRYLKTIDSIPNAVMSPEEKQLLRKDAYGHGKYGFETSRLQTAASGYAGFFEANKNNPDFAVSINGKPVTVGSAVGQEERAAATAALRSKFFEQVGINGIKNPQVLNKYLFDPIRQVESQLLSRESAAAAKRLQAAELDTAKTTLINAPNIENFNNLFEMLVRQGQSPGDARREAINKLIQSDNRLGIDSVFDSSFGPNGQKFRDQYPNEVKDAYTQLNEEREQTYQLSQYEKKVQSRQKIEEIKAAIQRDSSDGSLDVTPEYLSQEATKAKIDGDTDVAQYLESIIPLTSKSQYQDNITNQVDKQLSIGVIPSIAEIQNDVMLSPETKIALINKIEDKQASSVPAAAAEGAEKIIKSALDRVAGYDRIGGGKKHESLEWAIQTANSRWNSVYATEISRTGNHEAAKKAADDDFKAELNDADGLYKISEGKKDGGMGIFTNYDSSGKAYGFDSMNREVRQKLQSNPQVALTSDEELYEGETANLEQMSLNLRNSGKLVVPPVYTDIQQGSGGRYRVVDLINSRLRGLGLDELPPEITAVTDETEDILDTSGFNWKYRPNQVRTNIAAIGATGELVYITGNIGPTSTGQHLDVKKVGGGYFEYGDLDEYVEVEDPELGRVSLSGVPETGDFESHTVRGSHGRDYGTYSGSPLYLKNGAKVVSQEDTEHGNYMVIQLPNGDQYSFLHGTAAPTWRQSRYMRPELQPN